MMSSKLIDSRSKTEAFVARKRGFSKAKAAGFSDLQLAELAIGCTGRRVAGTSVAVRKRLLELEVEAAKRKREGQRW
jgi:hypothetical protein